MQLATRAFVRTLVALATRYTVTVEVNRDSSSAQFESRPCWQRPALSPPKVCSWHLTSARSHTRFAQGPHKVLQRQFRGVGWASEVCTGFAQILLQVFSLTESHNIRADLVKVPMVSIQGPHKGQTFPEQCLTGSVESPWALFALPTVALSGRRLVRTVFHTPGPHRANVHFYPRGTAQS